jgi:hypothetical protein
VRVKQLLYNLKISGRLLSFCLAVPFVLHAQDPGAQQDAEAAREKLLKAADQLDMIESNSETTKTAVDNMKADIVKLQDENTALKQQLSELQATFDKAESARIKERQVLLDEVAKMVATGKGSSVAKSSTKKKDPSTASTTSSQVKTPATDANAVNVTPAANSDVPPGTDPTSAVGGTTGDNPGAAGDANAGGAQPEKGYYHVVESGETLTLICSAYRQQGVHVTVAQVLKANGLTDKSILKVGQKLFIPKPGN